MRKLLRAAYTSYIMLMLSISEGENGRMMSGDMNVNFSRSDSWQRILDSMSSFYPIPDDKHNQR